MPLSSGMVLWGASGVERSVRRAERADARAILLGLTFLILFLAAVRDGQFEDLDDPARRVLQDDD